MTSSKKDPKQQVASIPKFSELEEARESIIAKLDQYSKVLNELGFIFIGLNLHLSDVEKSTSFYGDDANKVEIEKILQNVDRRLWDLAISSSGVSAVLSSEGESQLRKKYQDNPVAFSAVEADRVINRLAENTNALAASTVRSVFEKMTGTNFRRGNNWHQARENRSHDKIRKSFRFSHFSSFDRPGWISEDRFDLFNDLELVCRMVNHLPKLLRPNRLGDRMYQDRWTQERAFPREFSADHFTLQVFKCGNVKIDFTCMKTLELLNRYGADGRTLVDPLGGEPKERTS